MTFFQHKIVIKHYFYRARQIKDNFGRNEGRKLWKNKMNLIMGGHDPDGNGAETGRSVCNLD
jgi:hypothetical protein